MPVLSKVTKKYLLDFCFRLSVFLFVAAVYVLAPQQLEFTRNAFTVPLVILWIAVIFSMLIQLNPKSALTTGCLKQFPSRHDPVAVYDAEKLQKAVREQNVGAVKVAAVWVIVNALFWALYHMGRMRSRTLILLCALCYLCDLVCVLFFCPFQFFLMHNRCCVNCRIFAWGSWMMAAPLMGVPHLYSWSLAGAGIVVLAVWEWRYRRHPERFWFGSNRNLQCAHCAEKLCRYKVPHNNMYGNPAFRLREKESV